GTFAGASYAELSEQTGLPEERLEAVVSKLAELGLIEPPEPAPVEIEPAAEPAEISLGADLGDLLPPSAEPPEEGSQAAEISLDLGLPEEPEADLVSLLDSAIYGLTPAKEGGEAKAGAAKAAAKSAGAAAKPLEGEAKPADEAGEEEIELNIA